jgi:hypothetical protein
MKLGFNSSPKAASGRPDTDSRIPLVGGFTPRRHRRIANSGIAASQTAASPHRKRRRRRIKKKGSRNRSLFRIAFPHVAGNGAL